MQCNLCPVACGVDREQQLGRCGVKGLTVAKYYLHPYEEPPISFRKGSGTVFFGGCSLRCVFCQNYELSRAQRGKAVTPRALCDIMQELEDMGADNINFVTPDHVSDLIGEALSMYKPSIPVVYNSSGYCRVEALKNIEPYIDVWLPDLKFYSPELSFRYTGRRDYFDYAKEAIPFMAQKPMLWSADGKLLSGVIIRHLVLPMCTSDSLKLLNFLAQAAPHVPLSIMRQYIPMGDVGAFPELQRKITDREYARVTDCAISLGFQLYLQDKESAKPDFIPDWEE